MRLSNLLLFASIVLLCGCAVNPVTGRNELALLPVSPEEEAALGGKAFPGTIQQMGGEVADPQLGAYVNRVGLNLGRVSERPDLNWQFKVVNDSAPNAFALPGGYIAVTRGLLVNLENEAQLAAVLGHEVGHVTARHSVQGLQRGALANVALAVLSGVAGSSSYAPLLQQAGQLSAVVVDRTYSRGQERESDRLGIDYMVRAGYDPKGAVQLQEFFYRKMEGGAEPSWVGGIFRSHPFSKERMLENEEYIRLNHPRAAGELKAEPFRKGVAGVMKTRGAYQLFDKGERLEKEGKVKEAIAAYEEAAKAAPGEALILTGLGMAHLQSKNPQGAQLYLEKAVAIDPNYFLSRLGLGYVRLELGDGAKAVPDLEASMKLLPSAQGGYLLATAYEKTGRRSEALELYRAVAKTDPNGKLGRAAAARVQALAGG